MQPAACLLTVIIILFVIVVVIRYSLFTAEITQLYVYRRSLFFLVAGRAYRFDGRLHLGIRYKSLLVYIPPPVVKRRRKHCNRLSVIPNKTK